jgi:carbon storage regulator
MLVLSRKPGEQIVIGGHITVTVAEVRGNKVRLAIDAPGDIPILRAELLERLEADPDLAGKPAEWRAPDRQAVAAR